MKRTFVARLVVALGLLAVAAGAHSRPLSYSFWKASGESVEVRAQLTVDDVAALGFDLDAEPSAAERAGDALARLLRMRVGGTECTVVDAPVRLPAGVPWAVWHWRLRCPVAGERSITAELPALFSGGHRHLVRWDGGGGPALDQVLELSKDTWTFGGGRAGGSFFDYLGLGVEHLLTGWDHIVFIVALLLLADKVRDVVALVTSFTVAHSITLALSVLHVVKPDVRPVEALIGFSIALLGVENAWLLAGRGIRIPAVVLAALGAAIVFGGGVIGRTALVGLALFTACHFGLLARSRAPGQLRLGIAFAFGLIHGFGFAGAMAVLDLPARRLAPALFGFNLGVEVGQLGIVLVGWPALRALRRYRGGRWYAPSVEAMSAAVAGVGLFWLVTRMFG